MNRTYEKSKSLTNFVDGVNVMFAFLYYCDGKITS